MLKKIGAVFISAATGFIGGVHAETISLQPNYEISKTIAHGEQIDIVNYLIPISGICTITMQKEKSTMLTATVLKPTIKLGGQEILVNQPLSIPLYNGSSFALSASGSSAVRLKNVGEYDITAVCRTN
ncbi:MAG: hypothetical protein H0U75_05000 [Legionella sp.]|nr:hypothetical protein [Legionella sp.]